MALSTISSYDNENMGTTAFPFVRFNGPKARKVPGSLWATPAKGWFVIGNKTMWQMQTALVFYNVFQKFCYATLPPPRRAPCARPPGSPGATVARLHARVCTHTLRRSSTWPVGGGTPTSGATPCCRSPSDRRRPAPLAYAAKAWVGAGNPDSTANSRTQRPGRA